MAREKLREGHTDALDILDAIHSEIHEHTPLWKNEIADIIRSQMPRTETRSGLQSETARLNRELSQHYPPAKDDGRSQARLTQIKKQLADNQRRMETGDFKKEPRQKPIYHEEVEKAQVELEASRRAIDREVRKIELGNRSPLGKAADLMLEWRHMSILSGITTILKLGSAAASRIVSGPLEGAATSVIRHIPGISTIAEQSPRYSRGLSPKAEMAALRKTFSKETLVEARNVLLKGENKYDLLYGKPGELLRLYPALAYIPQAHGALKYPAFVNEFTRSVAHRSEFETRAAVKQGMSPDEALAYLASPETQMRITAGAYADGKRAILMGDSPIYNRFKAFLQDRVKEGVPGKGESAAVTRVGKYLVPVAKTPVNFTGELASYKFGAGRALGEIILNKGVKNLTPDQADFIMRNLTKQTLGIAYFALGAYVYKNIDTKSGDIKMFGHTIIPHQVLHLPMFSMLGAGALWGQLMHDRSKKGGSSNAAIGAAKYGMGDIPFFGVAQSLERSFRNSESAGVWAGRELSSLVPKGLGDLESVYHWLEGKAEPKRSPRTFSQALKMNVPGLRDEIPRKQVK